MLSRLFPRFEVIALLVLGRYVPTVLVGMYVRYEHAYRTYLYHTSVLCTYVYIREPTIIYLPTYVPFFKKKGTYIRSTVLTYSVQQYVFTYFLLRSSIKHGMDG